MKIALPMILTLIFSLAAFAQPNSGRSNPPKTAAPAQQASGKGLQNAPAAPASAPKSDSPVEAILSEDLIRALRDPFQLPPSLLAKKENPKSDLEVYPLRDFKLNGVINGPNKTRAMVTTPNNKVFFVKMGDRIGAREGKVVRILTDAIQVKEFYTDEHGMSVPDIYELKLTGELVSLSKKDKE